MKQHIYYTDLHSEHELWAKELAFFEDEVNFFEKRLGEIASKNTDKEMLAELEHYQNSFIRQKEIIDELQHEIVVHEDKLQEFVEDHPVAIDHVHFSDHKEMRDKMMTNRKIYTDLKNDYFRYLSKWM